jgi:hypothetical protein
LSHQLRAEGRVVEREPALIDNQHALAGAGRADYEGVADVADMKRQPERRCAFGLGEQERRPVEVVVAFGACPHR